MSAATLPPEEHRVALPTGILWSAFAVSTVAVFLRFCLRIQKRAHGWDDYAIYIAWAVGVATIAVGELELENGLGRHIVYVKATYPKFFQYQVMAEILVTLGICLVRCSVILLLLRLISITNRKLKLELWMLFGMNLLYNIVALTLLGTRCIPLAKAWDASLQGFCYSTETATNVIRANGVIGCVLDFACVGIAFVIIYCLQLRAKTKWSLIFLMSLSLFTAACAVAKAVTTEYASSADYTWTSVDPFIWTGLELYLGILVACLPTIHGSLLKAVESMKSAWQYISSRNSSTRLDDRTEAVSRDTAVDVQKRRQKSDAGSEGTELTDSSSMRPIHT